MSNRPARCDVVVSVVNDSNRTCLAACLDALPGAAAGTDIEVVVTDNVSVDASLDMLDRDHPDVSVVANPARRGFAANHNVVLSRVLAAGSARAVLILNDDVVMAPGSLAHMLAVLDGVPRAGAVAPQVLDHDGVSQPVRLAVPTARSAWRFDARGRGEGPVASEGWLQGCCILLSAAAAAEVGGYDERFYLFFEDVDLSVRLRRAGWDLVVDDAATVVHTSHRTVLRPELAGFSVAQGAHSRWLYHAKHHGERRANAVAAVGRGLLAGRAAGRAASAVLHRRPAELVAARALAARARRDPRRPVPVPAPAPVSPGEPVPAR